MNKLSYIGGLFTLIVLSLSVSLSSCSDDQKYDVVGDPDNIIYIKTPSSQYSFVVVHTPAGDFNNVSAKFPVFSLRGVTDEINVTLEQDNSLIESYNNANGTSYQALPDGLLNIDNSSVPIVQDAVQSEDSVSITVDKTKTTNLTEGVYLVPLRLASLSNNSAKISSNMSSLYILLTVSSSNIRENEGSASMVGTLITDYSEWTGTSSTSSSGSVANLFDGDEWGGWGFNQSPSTIVLDMQSVKRITGIRALSLYASFNSYYTFDNIKFWLSRDNITFDKIGDQPNSKMANEAGYQYISMYAPVEARYLKLELTWRVPSLSIFSELGIYAE